MHLQIVCRIPGGITSEQRRGEESPPSNFSHAFFNAAQDTIEFLGYESALLAHVQFPMGLKVDDMVLVVLPFPSNAVSSVAGVNFFVANQQLISWK